MNWVTKDISRQKGTIRRPTIGRISQCTRGNQASHSSCKAAQSFTRTSQHRLRRAMRVSGNGCVEIACSTCVSSSGGLEKGCCVCSATDRCVAGPKPSGRIVGASRLHGCTHEATRDETVDTARPPEGLNPICSRHDSIEPPPPIAPKPARWAHFGVITVPLIPSTHFATASASVGQIVFSETQVEGPKPSFRKPQRSLQIDPKSKMPCQVLDK